MFEELLISVLFIIVLIILCVISNLYSKKEEKINELNRLLIDELIEDIVVREDGNIKVIFKYEDKYFEDLDFINKQKYDIILSSWKRKTNTFKYFF